MAGRRSLEYIKHSLAKLAEKPANVPIFQSGRIYTAKHRPSGENWLIIGINTEVGTVCCAGWPPTISRLSNFEEFEDLGEIDEDTLQYRNNMFGTDWL